MIWVWIPLGFLIYTVIAALVYWLLKFLFYLGYTPFDTTTDSMPAAAAFWPVGVPAVLVVYFAAALFRLAEVIVDRMADPLRLANKIKKKHQDREEYGD